MESTESEIAFKPEDAIGLPSEIAFKIEEEVVPRYIRRAEKKAKTNSKVYRFTCPNCGNIEWATSTSFKIMIRDSKTGEVKPLPHRKIHRQCSRCGTNMVKISEKRELKRIDGKDRKRQR
jgi:predicted RNA-binding Zn-ribbon protein involved in translation (DUF1610 family)